MNYLNYLLNEFVFRLAFVHFPTFICSLKRISFSVLLTFAMINVNSIDFLFQTLNNFKGEVQYPFRLMGVIFNRLVGLDPRILNLKLYKIRVTKRNFQLKWIYFRAQPCYRTKPPPPSRPPRIKRIARR